jgi:hypothetical protein
MHCNHAPLDKGVSIQPEIDDVVVLKFRLLSLIVDGFDVRMTDVEVVRSRSVKDPSLGHDVDSVRPPIVVRLRKAAPFSSASLPYFSLCSL